jgi:hypothetical protein
MNTDKVNLAPKHLRIWGVELEFHAFRGLWLCDKRLNDSPGCFGPVGKEIPLSKPGIKIIIRFGVRIAFSTKTLRTGGVQNIPPLLLSYRLLLWEMKLHISLLVTPTIYNLPLECETKFKPPYKTNGNIVSYMMFPNLLTVSKFKPAHILKLLTAKSLFDV